MAISPRSLSHALRLELRSPRVRASRTPEGGRVLAFDPPETVRPQEPNAAEQMPTPTPDPLVPRAEGFSGRVGERFIDDPTEVGFRAGLLRSARENYDFYAADRPDELQRFGPVEPVRLADGTERPALKLTPDVRARIAGGETPAQFDQRPRFMFGAGDGGDLNGQFRVDSEGRVFALPFRDRWGDPRFNPEDRAHAMAALQEIADRGPAYWRDAPWDQVVAAHDAIDEILAQLPSYNRDYLSAEAEASRIRLWGDAESARRRGFGGDMQEYYRYQQGMAPYGEGWDGALIPHQPEAGRAPRRTPVPDDVADIVSTARAAADALLRSRRRGLRDLIQWDRRADPDAKAGGPGAKRGRPPARMPLDRNARFSAVRRAAEALGDEWFVDPDTGRGGRPGSQVLGALRKARNVTQAEIDHTELFSLLGRRDAPLTREQLLAWIDDRALLLQLRTAEFDPARPTRDYQDMGGTRSFNGPRVPGYGRYFEREYKFPPRVGRRGEEVEAATWDHPHSNHDGVMSSVRGSVRDVPKLGKGVLAEEVQFDFYQHEVTGRVKVEPDPIKRGQAFRRRQDLQAARSSVLSDYNHLRRRIMNSADLDPTVGRQIAPLTARMLDDRFNPEKWVQVRDAFEAAGGTPEWAAVLINDALGHIERWGAALGQTDNVPVRAPMPLSFDHAIRFALRDVFIKNAREGGAWVAIPTGKLNDRIQANTYTSAAHFYDGQLKRALERIARDIDPSLQIEEAILPAPPLKRGVPVYIVKGITPETNARLLADGLPRYGLARRADGGPMNDLARAQEVEALLRTDERWGKTAAAMIDAGDLVLAPSREALPEHMRDIPQWVGAVADYTTGKTYFITRNLSDQQLRALLVHEVGVHQELKPMLGAKRYGAFLEYVRSRLVDAERRFAANRASGGRAIRTDPWLEALDRVKGHHSQPYREALGLEGEHARAPDDPADLTDYELEEVAAHVAEALEMAHEHADAETRKALEPDLAWWQQILEAVRRWAATALGIGDLKGRDVHTLAVAALRRAGRRAEQTVGARREQPAPMVAVDSARILRFAKAKGFDGDDPQMAALWLDQQGYFSPALEAARRFPQESATREQMVGWLQNQPGVKKEELRTLMLDEFVAGGERATRADFLQWMKAHRYETELQWLEAGAIREPRWGAYTYFLKAEDRPAGWRSTETPPAPTGYFEAVVTPRPGLAGSEFSGGHISVPGNLMHVRGVRETSVGGKPSALLIEVQSDLFDAPREAFTDAAALRAAQRRLGPLAKEIVAESDGWLTMSPGFVYDVVTAPFVGEPKDSPLRGAIWGSTTAEAIDRRAPTLPREVREVLARKVYEYNSLIKKLEAAGAAGARTNEIPFRTTWPLKAYTDVVRTLIRQGADRIAWSDTDAVRSIAGMSTYQGDLYDKRLVRYAREWLGVEPRKALVDDATPRQSATDFSRRENAVFLAMYENRRDVGPLRGHKELDLLHEAMEDLARSRFDFFSETAKNPDARQVEQDRFVREIQTYKFSAETPFKQVPAEWRPDVLAYIRSQVSRAQDAVIGSNDARPEETHAWYFDVTPEVRERALGPRSLYFGIGGRLPPEASSTNSANKLVMTDREATALAANFERQRAGPDGDPLAAFNAAIASGDVQRAAAAVLDRYGARDGEAYARMKATDRLLEEGERAYWAQVAKALPQPAKPRDRQAPRRSAPRQASAPRDYRMQNPDGSPKAGQRETNAAVGALAAGAAALPAVGVAVAVNELEKGRQERKAEHERLLAEEQAGAKRRATQSYNRAEQKRINGALEAGAWQDLPEPKRPLRDMTLLERRAYVRQMVDLAERATGVSADLLFAKIARETAYSFLPDIESGSLDAADPNSRRAYGLGQFMPDTFSGELLRNGARLGFDAGGRTRKQLTSAADVQAMRGDPRFAVLMTAIHARENILTLRDRLGRDPTRAEVYAAHFFGVDRAIEFRGDVDADLGPDATQRKYRAEANANEQLFRPGGHKLSARQVFQNMQDEFGDEPVALGDGALFADQGGETSSQGR